MNCKGCRYGGICCSREGLPVIRVSPGGVVEHCGFNALHGTAEAISAALGDVQVVLSSRSHTTRVAVELRDVDALERAAQELGWAFWREREVAFYDRRVAKGPAVQPPGWHFPIVATEDGLVFDNYEGAWGNETDVGRLKGAYTLHVARKIAEGRGLDWQMVNGELVIFQPGGQSINVRQDGSVEAVGFTGSGCADATRFIEEVLGRPLETEYKPEFYGGSGQPGYVQEFGG